MSGAPAPILIECGRRSAGLGMRTSRTPFSNDAAMPSGSMPLGSVTDRRKEPKARSTRT